MNKDNLFNKTLDVDLHSPKDLEQMFANNHKELVDENSSGLPDTLTEDETKQVIEELSSRVKQESTDDKTIKFVRSNRR